jgi:hypothetical protein
VTGHLVDLSEEGACVAVDQDKPLPAECILEIPFGQDPQEAITIAAIACRITATQIGLRWSDHPNPEVLVKIQRLLAPGLGLRVVLTPVPKFVWSGS